MIRVWFGWVETWGYAGVFILMMMESSIIPVPSEIVMPPAAFWAAQGKMEFGMVIAAGILGGYVGSLLNYLLSQWIGQPILDRYGKYVLLPPAKVRFAREWIQRHGAFGVFTARLLPVVRHLISIPAGVLRMPLGRFSIATLLGAGTWCVILSWFGREVIGSHPELLQSPEAMMAVMKAKLHWFVGAVAVMAISYVFVLWLQRRSSAAGLTSINGT